MYIGDSIMHFSVKTNKLVYDFELFGKYSVLQGDSGTGKTTLHYLVSQASTNKAIQVYSDRNMYACPVDDFLARLLLENVQDSLIIIDESCDIIKAHDFSSILKDSQNYFFVGNAQYISAGPPSTFCRKYL